MEDGYTKALMALQKSHVWLRFPNFWNYYTNQWALKKKVKRSIVVPYCINISPGVGGGTIYFCLFADVGPSIPCGEAIVQQHKQGDWGSKWNVQVLISELLPEHVDVEAHLLAHPCICARTNGEVSLCEYLKLILYNETFFKMYYDNAICFWRYVTCIGRIRGGTIFSCISCWGYLIWRESVLLPKYRWCHLWCHSGMTS